MGTQHSVSGDFNPFRFPVDADSQVMPLVRGGQIVSLHLKSQTFIYIDGTGYESVFQGQRYHGGVA